MQKFFPACEQIGGVWYCTKKFPHQNQDAKQLQGWRHNLHAQTHLGHLQDIWCALFEVILRLKNNK